MARLRSEHKQADHLVALWHKPKQLASELDAMVGFLRMWEKDYGTEGEPRLAMIASMVGDIATLMCLDATARAERCKKQLATK